MVSGVAGVASPNRLLLDWPGRRGEGRGERRTEGAADERAGVWGDWKILSVLNLSGEPGVAPRSMGIRSWMDDLYASSMVDLSADSDGMLGTLCRDIMERSSCLVSRV